MTSSLPNKLYTVKYKERYIGVNNTDLLTHSHIITFPKKSYAHRVKSCIMEHRGIPIIGLNQQRHFILHKHVIDYRDEHELNTFDAKRLQVLEYETEPFIIQMGINNIRIAVIEDVLETLRFDRCYVCRLDEAPIEQFTDNLNNILKLS
jgi:hypothetical protein